MEYLYSFIIPHHNSPELLNRCLDSIPARDDIQIIVVDDNSKEDKRPQVSRSDVEVYYIDAAHTKGAGHARNVGLSQAQGKWLLFPDCDDYYNDGFLSILDKYAEQDIEVLYFNFDFIDGLTLEKFDKNYHQQCMSNYDGSQRMSEIIRFRNNPPWTKMIRKDFVRAHDMYFEEVPNGNDSLFSLFVGYNVSKFAVEKECVYIYVKNPNSIGTKKQSFSAILCRLTHCVKHNAFNEHIGRKEWKTPFLKSVYGHLKSCEKNERFSLLIRIIKEIPKMLINRREWIKIICEQ